MREAELFGENLTLRRTITTRYGENRICIEDEITNEGFRREPMMLLYHMNVGYPLLCEDSSGSPLRPGITLWDWNRRIPVSMAGRII